MTPSAIDRRSVLTIASATALGAAMPVRAATGARPIRALAFDGFTIFDPRAVAKAVLAVEPAQGAALASAWTSKIFALSWLETSAGRYSGFAALADAALRHSALALGVTLAKGTRRDLVDVFSALPAWPDAADRLEQWRSAGIRLAFLSNLSTHMLAENTRRNGLAAVMEAPLSTDEVRAFKPSPRAYALAMRHFALAREEIGFVAFGGWDALGARWFGYRTAWINRLAVIAEPLTPMPDATATDLSAVNALPLAVRR